MPNHPWKPLGSRSQNAVRNGMLLIVALAAALSFSQSACSKKNKVAIAPISAIRVTLLPFNIPSGDQQLRWTAMAAPIMLAKVSEYAKDIEIIPLWQSMPHALESGGASRSLTSESAALAAAYLGAKWSVMGEFTPTKSGVSMLIDFIPDRSPQIPFRFKKAGDIDNVASQMPKALNQFFYYLAIRRLSPIDKKIPAISEWKSLAETLDREYGWFAEAAPGKAEEAVANLARSDARLAQLLFNPSLYPVLAPTK
ncbi:MAG: hypothetical protein JXA73_18365 [Acidobacteria bacterium]|nr:hypothetical protein [Acidobacteriota bacterium]